jgi:hypothetical protein
MKLRWPKREPRKPATQWLPVAWTRNQPEADMLVNILRQSDVPAYARRHGSGDVPEMMSAGPHVVMVPASRALEAHALVDPIPAQETEGDDEGG